MGYACLPRLARSILRDKIRRNRPLITTRSNREELVIRISTDVKKEGRLKISQPQCLVGLHTISKTDLVMNLIREMALACCQRVVEFLRLIKRYPGSYMVARNIAITRINVSGGTIHLGPSTGAVDRFWYSRSASRNIKMCDLGPFWDPLFIVCEQKRPSRCPFLKDGLPIYQYCDVCLIFVKSHGPA